MILLLLSALLSGQPCKVVHYSYAAPSFLLHEGWSAEPIHMALATIVIPTATGPVLIDPAVGSQTVEDVRELPPWLRVQLRGIEKGPRLPDDVRPRAILVTHLHWDHLSGASDFGEVPIYVSLRERVWAEAIARESGFARGVLRTVIWRETPFLREASGDVLGDGSIHAIPLPGHTPGSVGYRFGDWLFVGDAVWDRDAVEVEGRKARLAGGLSGEDEAAAARTRAKLRALREANRRLHIIPAHDAHALSELPDCGG